MAKILTAVAIEKLKPDPTKRVEVSDGMLPALRVVVAPSGVKSFAVRFKLQGASKKLTIGPTSAFSLAEARDRARAALNEVARGNDPTQAKKTAKAELVAAVRALDDIVENVVEDFIRRYVSANKSAEAVSRLLRLELVPWKGRRIQEITKRDVIKLIDDVHERGSPTTARRLLANVKRLFSWLASRDVVTASPCLGLKPPSAEVVRDRVLSDDELRVIIMAAEATPYPFGPMVRLLALTGSRREEAAGMEWREVTEVGDETIWSLPPERTKNSRRHDISLAPQAAAVVQSLSRIANDAGEVFYAFTTTGRTSVSGYSRAKTLLDAKMLEFAKREAVEAGRDPSKVTAMPAWRFHDLRRTCATGMARLGIGIPIIERALNHASGTFGGIVSTYQRHDFRQETRHAFAVWGAHIEALSKKDGVPANVVRIKRAASR